MATLINQTHPGYEILNPETGQWVKFEGGRLDIEDDDPNYAVVMAEAGRNPSIAVYASVSTCVYCGEDFASKDKLAKHVKETHFEKWLEAQDAEHATTRQAEIKAREPFPCDAGCPLGTAFPTEEERSLHYQVMHAAPPTDSGDGDTSSGDVTDVKDVAAKGTRTRSSRAKKES